MIDAPPPVLSVEPAVPAGGETTTVHVRARFSFGPLSAVAARLRLPFRHAELFVG